MRGHASTRKGGPSHGAGQVFFTTNLTSKHQVSREIRNLRTSLPSSSSGNRDYTVWISRKCKTLLPSSPVKRRFESRKSRMSNRQCLPMSFRRVVTTGTLTETEMERRGRGGGRVRHGLITNRYNRILCRCFDRRIKNPSKYYPSITRRFIVFYFLFAGFFFVEEKLGQWAKIRRKNIYFNSRSAAVESKLSPIPLLLCFRAFITEK